PIANPRVAVIGAGWAGEFVHTRGWKAAGARLVGIADARIERAQRLAEAYEIENTYTDWRDMLDREKPDAVSVALPNAFHEEAVTAALQRGAHVLCEKPLSTTVASARRMFDAAR